MRRIRIPGFVLGLILVSSLGFGQGGFPLSPGEGGFKPGTEPNGFRGIKWGTDINTLPDMKYVKTDPSDTRLYVKQNDELKIGSATFKRIEYWFWRAKFYKVNICTEGYENWIGLKEAFFKKYGPGLHYQWSEHTKQYWWFGKKTVIILEYDEVLKEGYLWTASTEMNKQIVQTESLKKGAGKGAGNR